MHLFSFVQNVGMNYFWACSELSEYAAKWFCNKWNYILVTDFVEFLLIRSYGISISHLPLKTFWKCNLDFGGRGGFLYIFFVDECNFWLNYRQMLLTSKLHLVLICITFLILKLHYCQTAMACVNLLVLNMTIIYSS